MPLNKETKPNLLISYIFCTKEKQEKKQIIFLYISVDVF